MQKLKHPSSSYARILFRYLRLNEDDSPAFFKGTNVTYDELMTLDGTISRNDLSCIYRNALAISNLEALGLSVGTQLHMSTHGPLGVAAFSGPDLRTGLGLIARFSVIRADFFEISARETSEGMRIALTETFDLCDLRQFMTESVLSGLFSAITFFTGAGEFKGRVNIAYPKPDYWQKYSGHFGEIIKFNQPATEIIVSNAILSLPSPVADPVLHQEAVALCQRQFVDIKTGGADRGSESISAAVSKLMYENPGQLWTLNDVADSLFISRRTLIRRLEAEGTKFQAIRDELAKQQVVSYLNDASLSVESIGYLMGFSDTSSFRRSFKRWFGMSPSQYIARIR